MVPQINQPKPNPRNIADFTGP